MWPNVLVGWLYTGAYYIGDGLMWDGSFVGSWLIKWKNVYFSNIICWIHGQNPTNI